MTDALDWLWTLVDAARPTAEAHHAGSWPKGVLDRLVAEGFLSEDAPADRVLCPECLDHFEEVFARNTPDGLVDFWVACPTHLRVRVPQGVRRRWSADCGAIAHSLAVSLSLAGRITELEHRRVWRLGRAEWRGTSRDVLLARGLHWSDGMAVRGAISRARRPIVLVPRARPPENFWSGRVPPVIELGEVATLGAAGIEVETLELAAAIQDADSRVAEGSAAECTLEQLAVKVKRLIKTELTDDIYLEAYRRFGSLRKAAAFLSQETGTPITKDQVQRAVARAGGVDEVRNSESSDSVIRPCESRTRDRNGKVVVQTKGKQG